MAQGSTVMVASGVATLATRGISVEFGGVRAVDGVDLVLHRGEILGLIGPNGAGKTTLVNLMTGALRPLEGQVLLEGRDVTGWTPDRIARNGVARTFQNVRLFGDLSVLANVEVGAVGVGLSRQEGRRRAVQLLEWMHLTEKADLPANSLPYGQERRLGILRALAMQPRFLLLDEPAAGLDEAESDELIEFIFKIRDTFGCGVLVIEHDMRLIMRLCERIQVLDFGKTICEGSPEQVRADPAVITAYLGTAKGASSAHR